VVGGLSGPRHQANSNKMVWASILIKLRFPLSGMGGIMDTKGALEFFISGATAVSVGERQTLLIRKISLEIISD